jgi:hypothetical protein
MNGLIADAGMTGLLGRLRHLDGARVVAEHSSELIARVDVELREHLAEVVGDGVLADEQPLADGGVRESVAGESSAAAWRFPGGTSASLQDPIAVGT